jgi:aryl-alcohol dehydrogenase-like predicted oxidoreductase
MEYRILGGTGISVSTYCLGTMMFGAWGNPDADECTAMVGAALDVGINFIDTVDVYDDGVSEEILGRALRGRRDDIVLATKFHNPMGEDPNMRGNSRRWIVRAVEGSLRRLGTDWIDLYQVHRPDPATNIDETLGALSDLVHAGKVRAIGRSPSGAVTSASLPNSRRIQSSRAVSRQPSSLPASATRSACWSGRRSTAAGLPASTAA